MKEQKKTPEKKTKQNKRNNLPDMEFKKWLQNALKTHKHR